MKTIQMIAACIATGVMVCAAQAGTMDQWHSMFNLNDTNKGGTYVEMKGEATVSLYLQSGAPNGAVDFGYVVFTEGQGNQGGTISGDLVALTFNDEGYATIGGFNTGDTIAFWTRDAEGNVTYSANIEGGEGTYDNNFFSRVKQNEVFVPDYSHKDDILTMTSSGTTFSFSVVLSDGAGGTPSGQPLPGLLLTAGAGLGAAAVAMRKQRRNKKAAASQ